MRRKPEDSETILSEMNKGSDSEKHLKLLEEVQKVKDSNGMRDTERLNMTRIGIRLWVPTISSL